MSDFDSRPKGTVMYGAFDTFAPAERALRVLQNAGYARAAFEGADIDERPSGEPAVIVVDAAATGAVRAAEILEEFGAQIRFAGPIVELPAVALPAVALPAVAPLPVAPQTDDLLPYEPETIELENAETLPEQFVVLQGSGLAVAQAERKPRARKRARIDTPRANVPATSAPLARENIVIVTRTLESLLIDG